MVRTVIRNVLFPVPVAVFRGSYSDYLMTKEGFKVLVQTSKWSMQLPSLGL